MVEAALKRFERALECHVLVRRIPTDICIQADRDLLSLALRQLLDNAIKYSPETSTIEVVARGNGHSLFACRAASGDRWCCAALVRESVVHSREVKLQSVFAWLASERRRGSL